MISHSEDKFFVRISVVRLALGVERKDGYYVKAYYEKNISANNKIYIVLKQDGFNNGVADKIRGVQVNEKHNKDYSFQKDKLNNNSARLES